MHVRASMCWGLPVIDDGTQEAVGTIGDPVLDPDTGNILGFFIDMFFPHEVLFLQVIDIVAWGMQVHIRSRDRLAPPEEIIRLHRFFEGQRTILGQPIRIRKQRTLLGRCADIQFSTRHFTLEWLFPRRWFVYRQPIPASDVMEVTEDAVWVRDPLKPSKADVPESKSDEAVSSVIVESMPAA